MIDVILINAVIYVITLLFVIRSERRFSIYVLLWCLYTFTAVMGYIILKTDDWDFYNPNLGADVPFTPYLMAYLSLHLISYPFKGYDESNLNYTVLKPNKMMDGLCGVMLIAYIFLGIVSGTTAYIVANSIGGFGEAYEMANEGGSEGSMLSVILGSGLLYWIYRICCWIIVPTPIFIIYYLIKIHYNEHKWYRYVIFLIISQIRPLCSALIVGSRGALFFLLFDILFYFILFRKLFGIRFVRKVRLIFLIIVAVFTLVALAITDSRIENKHGYVEQASTQHSIMSYMGQAFPNLGYYYYDKLTNHPGGRRFFPELFSPNTEELYKKMNMSRTEYWNSKMNVPMEKFKTFWGDWYVEFGFIASIVGLILLFIFFKITCFNHKYHLFCIPILVYYFEKVCMFAFATGTGIAGSDAHKSFFISAIASYLLLVYERRNQRTKLHKIVNAKNRKNYEILNCYTCL